MERGGGYNLPVYFCENISVYIPLDWYSSESVKETFDIKFDDISVVWMMYTAKTPYRKFETNIPRKGTARLYRSLTDT